MHHQNVLSMFSRKDEFLFRMTEDSSIFKDQILLSNCLLNSSPDGPDFFEDELSCIAADFVCI